MLAVENAQCYNQRDHLFTYVFYSSPSLPPIREGKYNNTQSLLSYKSVTISVYNYEIFMEGDCTYICSPYIL